MSIRMTWANIYYVNVFLFLTPKCLPENSFFPDHNLFIINIGSQDIFFYREKNKTKPLKRHDINTLRFQLPIQTLKCVYILNNVYKQLHARVKCLTLLNGGDSVTIVVLFNSLLVLLCKEINGLIMEIVSFKPPCS